MENSDTEINISDEGSEPSNEIPKRDTISNNGLEHLLTLLMMVFTGVILFLVTKTSWSFKPIGDGSFPLRSHGDYSGYNLIGFCLIGILILIVTCHVYLSFSLSVGMKILFAAIVIVGSITAWNNYQKMGDRIWENSLKSWVESEYGLEYDSLIHLRFEGVIGKHGYKGQPNIYIDPPKDTRYLSSKEGKYLAELMTDSSTSNTVRIYKISNSEIPELLPKNNPQNR